MTKITIIIILCIVGLPGLLGFGIRMVPDGFQSSLDYPQKIYGSVTISQEIVSEDDLLSGVGVSIKNPNLQNKQDISFSLFQGETRLRNIVLNGKSIADGNFVKFLFAPIIGSKGQSYKVIFSAEEAQSGESLEIFLTKDTNGPRAAVGKGLSDAMLSDVLFYQTPSPFAVTQNIYKEWFKKLIADFPFLVIYITLLAGLGFLVFQPSKKNNDF